MKYAKNGWLKIQKQALCRLIDQMIFLGSCEELRSTSSLRAIMPNNIIYDDEDNEWIKKMPTKRNNPHSTYAAALLACRHYCFVGTSKTTKNSMRPNGTETQVIINNLISIISIKLRWQNISSIRVRNLLMTAIVKL